MNAEIDKSHIIYHYDLIQGTDEWYQARLGIITASEMKFAITPTLKIADNNDTRTHVYELASQRIEQFVEPQFESYDMRRGKWEEQFAKQYYSECHEQTKDCGFVTNSKYGCTIGYSPDWLIDEEGQAEVKSRKSKWQIKTILENVMPKEFSLQVQAGLLVTERRWCDFISYSNGLPMFILRVFPDDVVHRAIIEASQQFEEKINAAVSRYQELTADTKKYIPTERRDYEEEHTITGSDETNPVEYLMAG